MPALSPSIRRQALEAIVARLNVDRPPDIPMARAMRWQVNFDTHVPLMAVFKIEEKDAELRTGKSAKTGNIRMRRLSFAVQTVQVAEPRHAEFANDAAESWVLSRLLDWHPETEIFHNVMESDAAWEISVANKTYAVTAQTFECELQTLSVDPTSRQ